MDLKKATKQFSNRFACGCSVSKNNVGQNEVIIQGDVVDELVEYLQETWPNVGLTSAFAARSAPTHRLTPTLARAQAQAI